MITHEDIIEANRTGALLQTIAATPYDQLERVGRLLSGLHNIGEIDLLLAFEPQPLADVSVPFIYFIRQLFCQALPHIDCSAEAAETACTNVFERLTPDGTAILVCDSLAEWFRKTPARAEEGLTLIHRDPDSHGRLVRPVLLSGAVHDASRYVEEAFDLSNDSDSPVRLDALRALGQIVPVENETLLTRTFNRFNEVVDVSDPDEEPGIVVEAALNLLHRTDGGIVDAIAPLLEKVSRIQSSPTRQALANGLLHHRRHFSEAMTDAVFASVRHTTKHESQTGKMIDRILYQWDLDTDRKRVFAFLVKLFGQEDHALDLETLSDFRHQLRGQPGDVLGWYVVSLLLTGKYELCTAAQRLLPFKETRAGLDIDLDPFSLPSCWIPYLARKILGYCLLNKESAAALLLSCLRAVPEQSRAELEELVFDHFLLNYLTVIDWFESVVSAADRAKQSVNHLSSRLRAYVTELERCGTCPAFMPSERERQLQGYRQADFHRAVHKKAEQGSVLSTLAHKATVLYGTSGVVYVQRDADSEPQRQEVAIGAHEYSFEFPRLEVLDPVGSQYNNNLFRSECPPS